LQFWYVSLCQHDAVIEWRLRSLAGTAPQYDHPQLDHHLAAPTPVHHIRQL
jgi:hypothetical protein